MWAGEKIKRTDWIYHGLTNGYICWRHLDSRCDYMNFMTRFDWVALALARGWRRRGRNSSFGLSFSHFFCCLFFSGLLTHLTHCLSFIISYHIIFLFQFVMVDLGRIQTRHEGLGRAWAFRIDWLKRLPLSLTLTFTYHLLIHLHPSILLDGFILFASRRGILFDLFIIYQFQLFPGPFWIDYCLFNDWHFK